jgi:hypothetical protein
MPHFGEEYLLDMINFVHICINLYAKPEALNTHIYMPVHEQEDITVLWNDAVHTERDVTANWTDITTKIKKQKTCTLIDVAIPADRNVVQKER